MNHLLLLFVIRKKNDGQVSYNTASESQISENVPERKAEEVVFIYTIRVSAVAFVRPPLTLVPHSGNDALSEGDVEKILQGPDVRRVLAQRPPQIHLKLGPVDAPVSVHVQALEAVQSVGAPIAREIRCHEPVVEAVVGQHLVLTRRKEEG